MRYLCLLDLVIILSLTSCCMLSKVRAPHSLEPNHQLGQGSPTTALHQRLRRGWIWKQLFVPEEDPTPSVIGQLKSDYDRGDFAIKYILSGEGAGEMFEIDEYSGEIRTLQKLDREEKAFYLLQAHALARKSNEPVEPQSEFIIKVQDINDNIPQFQNEPYVSSIPEMCPMGIIMTSMANMDREARDQYLVVVQVKDMLGLSGGYSASTTVTISLTDVNDNGPTFQHNMYTFAVLESAAVGTTVGRIMADDGDVGINSRMNYSLEDLEESATFKIQTDPVTQEGVVLLAKPLDYESKRRFIMAAEAVNDHIDTRFLSYNEFRDRTTLKIVVEDVDEPPIFMAPDYEWKVPENAVAGTVVGTVSARDTDAINNPIRYSIDKSSDITKAFKIDPNNGTVTVAKPLDREEAAWHNLTLNAKETKQNHLSSSVVVFIKVLDINDNAPMLAGDYQPYICEGTQSGELIQLINAVDLDDPVEGHHFYFSMVPEKHINPNFTIRDNQDNSASILARRSSFNRRDRTQYLLPMVVADSGSPALSSTSTLTISVCSCQPAGHCPTGGVEALALSMGVSLQTLLGFLVCLATLTVLSIVMLMLRRHRRKQQEGLGRAEKVLELPKRVSEKVLHYGELGGGGGGDVGGFCQPAVPLRPHPRRRDRRLRREEVAASIRMSMSLRHSLLIGPEDDVFKQFIMDRLDEADQDPYVPPFDCLKTYAFEGTGSATGSLSSLESWDFVDSDQCPRDPGSRLVRLTLWHGGAEEETTF
ncbi:unnamed protein product [Coregonus sp. 'balchen']|nr:unnamed protein product [Coregonus sp. 'balchen']